MNEERSKSISSFITRGRIVSFVVLFVFVLILGSVFVLLRMLDEGALPSRVEKKNQTFWSIQSIDTMKYSRDLAREKAYDPSFDAVIDQHMQLIAAAGATHVAIGTPYDPEFIPFMRRWVASARRNGLKVWFRGNFAGWEEWFDYSAINRAAHTQKLEKFILENRDLFEDGDAFSSCPECENGGPGDPRHNGDVVGHRKFLIEEYRVAKKTFEEIGKDVQANLYSMNGDVAYLVMNEETTKALDGVVTIDHYVATPDRLIRDIDRFKERSKGQIILGEIGVPIPDIHGNLSEVSQAKWLDDALRKLVASNSIIGINYWVAVGGSTSLWEAGGRAKPSSEEIQKFFKPQIMYGIVKDELDRPIANARIGHSYYSTQSDEYGFFQLPFIAGDEGEVAFSADGYTPLITKSHFDSAPTLVTLVKEYKTFMDRIFLFLKSQKQK